MDDPEENPSTAYCSRIYLLKPLRSSTVFRVIAQTPCNAPRSIHRRDGGLSTRVFDLDYAAPSDDEDDCDIPETIPRSFGRIRHFFLTDQGRLLPDIESATKGDRGCVELDFNDTCMHFLSKDCSASAREEHMEATLEMLKVIARHQVLAADSASEGLNGTVALNTRRNVTQLAIPLNIEEFDTFVGKVSLKGIKQDSDGMLTSHDIACDRRVYVSRHIAVLHTGRPRRRVRPSPSCGHQLPGWSDEGGTRRIPSSNCFSSRPICALLLQFGLRSVRLIQTKVTSTRHITTV